MDFATKSKVSFKVYLEDTDAGGVVYHSNYLKYMERARTEFIRQYGLGRSYMLKNDLVFLVRKLTINYFAPAYLDDNLSVSAAITKAHKYAVTFKQQVIRIQDDKLLSSSIVQVVCVHAKRKKLIALPLSLS